MSKATRTETRQLNVSPHIIYSLIKAQAGTLAKGVLECVMNSVDAGATAIDIKVTNKTLQVIDNGCGFSTRDEILKCFEVFGFEHKEGDRTYGQFGIGRAQLWNFCTTKWRTRSFSMDVDIKNKGLDYVLQEDLKDIPGLTIQGTFYTPLKTSEVLAFEKEFAALALYAQVPVVVNGRQVNKDPSKEKWTHETPEAWISIRESGNLQVYNLGVFVREYPAYQIGSGGKVVTKPGVRLSLNMARNDIILTDCKVWKKIKPFLQKQSDQRVKTQNRKMTSDETDNIAMRFMAGAVLAADVKSIKLITDITGKTYTVEAFLRKADGLPIITGEKDDLKLIRLQEQGLAFVLADATLSRFGVSTPVELQALFTTMATKRKFTHDTWRLKGLKFENDASKISALLSNDFKLVDKNSLNKEEAAILKALNVASAYLVRFMPSDEPVSYYAQPRTVHIGESEQAHAWTDGISTIVIERKTLKLARKGLAGIHTLVNILVHEYIHCGNSAGSHVHDDEFFQTYHDLTLGMESGYLIANASQSALRVMLSEFRDKNITLIKPMKDSIDDLDAEAEVFETEKTVTLQIVPTVSSAIEVDVLDLKPKRGHPRKVA